MAGDAPKAVLLSQAAEAVIRHPCAAVFQQAVAGHILLRLAGMPDAVTRGVPGESLFRLVLRTLVRQFSLQQAARVIVVIASRVIAGDVRQPGVRGILKRLRVVDGVMEGLPVQGAPPPAVVPVLVQQAVALH